VQITLDVQGTESEELWERGEHEGECTFKILWEDRSSVQSGRRQDGEHNGWSHSESEGREQGERVDR